MARRISAESLSGIRALYDVGVAVELADGRLIERFLTAEGEAREAAFWALVDRHGPTVVRTCRGVLRDEHEARDVAQGVFLALARRAAGLRRRDSIGPWLHRVALRAAVRSRREALRRAELGRKLAATSPTDVVARTYDDAGEILHDEIDRLPRRSREAVVACDLEGLAYAAAAARLGLPVRTLQSRLHRGRARLKVALIRRGVGLGLAEVLLRSRGEAATPTAWAEGLARTASRLVDAPAAFVWLARCAAVLVAGAAIAGAGSLTTAPPARSAVQEPEAKPKSAPPGPATAALLAPFDRDEARRVLREASSEVLAIGREAGHLNDLVIDALVVAQAKAGDIDGARDTLDAAGVILAAPRKRRKAAEGAPDARGFSALVRLARTAQVAEQAEISRRLIDGAIVRFGPDPDGDLMHFIAPSSVSEVRPGGSLAWRSPLPLLALPDAVHVLRFQSRSEEAATLARRARDIVIDLYPSLKMGERDRGRSSVEAAVRVASVAILAGVSDDLDGAIREARLRPEDRPMLLRQLQLDALRADRDSARRLLRIVRKEVEAAEPDLGVSIRLATLLAAAGEWSEAWEILCDESRRPRRSDTDSALDRLVDVLDFASLLRENHADLDGGVPILRRAAEGVPGRPDNPFARHIPPAAVTWLVTLGDCDGAARILARIPEADRSPNVLLKLARGFAIEGREDRSAEFLKQALAHWREPPADVAKAFLENASATRTSLEALIPQFASLDRIDESLVLARAFPDEQERRTALGGVVRVAAERGEFARALRLARADAGQGRSTLIYESLADGIRWRLEAEERVNRPGRPGPR